MSSGSASSCRHTATRLSTAVKGLEVLLQQPETALDAETICSLLCSTSAIRTAAQLAGGPCSSIALQGDVDHPDTLSRVASFARWLPAHAHLLADIDVYMQTHTANFQSACNVVDTLLVFGFQQASSNSGSSSGRVGSVSAAPRQQVPLFALHSFSSSARHSAQLLAALPAATLTHLQLETHYADETGWALSSISRLTRLKCLALEGRMSSSWLPALGPLTQLTSLDITTLDAHPADVWAFPASLVRLQLPGLIMYDLTPEQIEAGQVSLEDGPSDLCLALSHLTRLTRLQLAIAGRDAAHISGKLPPQLLELDAVCKTLGVLPLLGVTTLQQLQRLVLRDCKEQRTELGNLALLPALTNLELTYSNLKHAQHAQQTSTVWARLPQLRSLSLSLMDGEDAPQGDWELEAQELQELLVDLGAARSLQRLSLKLGNSLYVPGGPVKLFGYLTSLQQLRELRVSAGQLVCIAEDGPSDALNLTKLTQLTQLAVKLWNVGSVAAVALACNLTQLRWLELVECRMTDAAAVPAVGKLTQLQHLDLSRNSLGSVTSGRVDECLLFLTELRALTYLQLGNMWSDRASKDALDRFWSIVRGQPNE